MAVLLIGFAVSVQLATGKNKVKLAPSTTRMEPAKRAAHALNRLTFGPRPGDIEKV